MREMLSDLTWILDFSQLQDTNKRNVAVESQVITVLPEVLIAVF